MNRFSVFTVAIRNTENLKRNTFFCPEDADNVSEARRYRLGETERKGMNSVSGTRDTVELREFVALFLGPLRLGKW